MRSRTFAPICRDTFDWEPWFAWRPTVVVDARGRWCWVWLETIERAKFSLGAGDRVVKYRFMDQVDTSDIPEESRRVFTAAQRR